MMPTIVQTAAEKLAYEWGTPSPSVDVERVAQRLGLRTLFMDVGDKDVSGMLISQVGLAPCIVVNVDHHRHRQRFTIAHEIGHFYLKHQFTPGSHVHVDRGSYVSFRGPDAAKGTNKKEVDANSFASSLLMPAKLVRDQAGDSSLSDEHVEELAKLFDVSVQAMVIRLSVLKLLG